MCRSNRLTSRSFRCNKVTMDLTIYIYISRERRIYVVTRYIYIHIVVHSTQRVFFSREPGAVHLVYTEIHAHTSERERV